MIRVHCNIDFNNGTIVEDVPVMMRGCGLTEEYGVAVINGIVYSVTRNTMTMPNNMFYRGLTWDEEMIEHLNVIRDINK
jgi:hypothetical protein